MLARLSVALLLVCAALQHTTASTTPPTHHPESYSESLTLSPFPDGKVLSTFNFSLSGTWDPEGVTLASNTVSHHHTLLPRLLTSLIRQYRFQSFHLTLSSGRWSSAWPLAAPAPSQVPASGIELTAWLELLEGENEAEERKRWEGFTGAVGGLFCAGIGSEATKAGTDSPGWSVPFEGQGEEREHRLYRLLLPRLSAACTESLTPFLSLLPCASHAGLSSLLNPHRLFDAEWTLIGVKVTYEEATEEIRAELEVGAVSDPVRRDRLSGQLGGRGFSLSSLYDRSLSRSCPVASSSFINFVVPTHSVNPFQIEPATGRSMQSNDGADVAVWDVNELVNGETLDISVRWPEENVFRYPAASKLPPPPLQVRRLLFGVGQERGQIGVEITNNLDAESEVVWGESWPWWVRGFISTLEVKIDGNASSDVLLDLDYHPSIARQRPTTIQALLHLPPYSTTQLLLSYESATLWYTEYPSDANRGFSVPGASISLLPPRSSHPSSPSSPRQPGFFSSRKPLLRLRTPTALISLPLPDFSMPYNVIILTSTVVALFFGSVVNGLVRRWFVVDLGVKVGMVGGEGKRGKEL